jgi:hypothetical protein
MAYQIENSPASHNGWFTPAESNAYYRTRYAREGITVHWWGDGTGADNHDNIVRYMQQQSAAGIKSVNFVLSDNKISQLVDPDNVAWCSEGGNPTTISVETQPTLGDEGYKKWGWLVNELERRYGHTLSLYPHNHWYNTTCPGSIDINRIRDEANKWKNGYYGQGGVDVAIIQNADNWRGRFGKTMQLIRGRAAGPNEMDPWVGQDFLHAVEAIEDSPEAEQNAADAQLGKQARANNWQGQIQSAAQTKLDMQKTIDALNAQVQKALADDNADKSKLQDALKQIELLTTQLAAANKSSQSPASTPAESSDPGPLAKLLALIFRLKK